MNTQQSCIFYLEPIYSSVGPANVPNPFTFVLDNKE